VISKKNGKEVIATTYDHKPHYYSELQRIFKKGGELYRYNFRVCNKVGCLRINSPRKRRSAMLRVTGSLRSWIERIQWPMIEFLDLGGSSLEVYL
jgi:hypothetical protein